MSARYVVVAYPCPEVQASNLTAYFAHIAVAYWRISPSTWLLSDGQNRNLRFWIDTTHKIAPNARIVVVKADPGWIAWGDGEEFHWMRNIWAERK